jgi:hypothetical protein
VGKGSEVEREEGKCTLKVEGEMVYEIQGLRINKGERGRGRTRT